MARGVKSVVQREGSVNVKNFYDLNNQLVMLDIQGAKKENLLNLRKQLNIKEGILYTSPVLLDEAGREVGGYTNQVIKLAL